MSDFGQYDNIESLYEQIDAQKERIAALEAVLRKLQITLADLIKTETDGCGINDWYGEAIDLLKLVESVTIWTGSTDG